MNYSFTCGPTPDGVVSQKIYGVAPGGEPILLATVGAGVRSVTLAFDEATRGFVNAADAPPPMLPTRRAIVVE